MIAGLIVAVLILSLAGWLIGVSVKQRQARRVSARYRAQLRDAPRPRLK